MGVFLLLLFQIDGHLQDLQKHYLFDLQAVGGQNGAYPLALRLYLTLQSSMIQDTLISPQSGNELYLNQLGLVSRSVRLTSLRKFQLDDPHFRPPRAEIRPAQAL